MRASLVIAASQCLRRAWLEQQPAPPSAAQRSAARNSRVLRGLSRRLFPGAVEVPSEDGLARTLALLGTGRPLLNASFGHAGLEVRADALVPGPGGWSLHRFRPATRNRSWHLDELGLQVGVLGACGLQLREAWLHRLNRRYVRGPELDPRAALRSVEHLAELRGRELPSMPALPEDEPDIGVGEQCRRPRRCPFLGHCGAEPGPYSLERIPRGNHLHREARLRGIEDWRELPGELRLTGLQERMLEALRRGEALLDPSVLPELRPGEPAHFLDFEAYAPALPQFEGLRPYDPLIVQFSLHSSGSAKLRHRALLVEEGDPRPQIAEALLEALVEPGPVFVYGGFEARALGGLAEALPSRAGALRSVARRIVDLMPLLQRGCVHPDFGGGFGLKRVLPVMCPGEGYEDLELVGGDEAAASYGELVDPETPGPRKAALRTGLLAYCERDTWALMRLREGLVERLG